MISIRRFCDNDHDEVIGLIQGIMSKEFAQDSYAYPTADLDTIADLSRIPSMLTARGYKAADIENIAHGNWIRFLKETWG